MKILFDVQFPYAWTPGGGVRIHVSELMGALASLGVEVEPLRWWDPDQTGGVVSTFNWPGGKYLFARKKGMRIVSYIFLDEFGSRKMARLLLDRVIIRGIRRFLKGAALELGWCDPEIADAFIYPSRYVARLGSHLFGADAERSFVIQNGVPAAYFVTPGKRKVSGNFLISIGRITESKNTVLLARIARSAKVPVLFLGQPLSTRSLFSKAPTDPYVDEFRSLVDQKYVLYRGFVSEEEKIGLIKEARGFILLSQNESGCIAALEALAADKPDFLPDCPWARGLYDDRVRFGDMGDREKPSGQVARFYRESEAGLADLAKYPTRTWKQIAAEYLKVYEYALTRVTPAAA